MEIYTTKIEINSIARLPQFSLTITNRNKELHSSREEFLTDDCLSSGAAVIFLSIKLFQSFKMRGKRITECIKLTLREAYLKNNADELAQLITSLYAQYTYTCEIHKGIIRKWNTWHHTRDHKQNPPKMLRWEFLISRNATIINLMYFYILMTPLRLKFIFFKYLKLDKI